MEGQNHVGSPKVNSTSVTNGSSHHSSSKSKQSSHHSSSKPSTPANKDGTHKSSSSSHSSSKGYKYYVKKEDGTYVKVLEPPKSGFYYVKKSDGTLIKMKPRDPNKHSSSSSSKPKDPNAKSNSSNHSSSKHSSHKPSSKDSHKSSSKPDGVKHSSSDHKKVSSSGEQKKHSSSGDHKKHSTSDGEHRKSSSGEVRKSSSSDGIKKEKRPEKEIKKEPVDSHKVKVKTEDGVKVKTEVKKEEVKLEEEEVKVKKEPKTPSPVKAVKKEPTDDEEDYENEEEEEEEEDDDDDEVLSKVKDSKQGIKRSLTDEEDDDDEEEEFQSKEKKKVQKTSDKAKKRKIKEEEDEDYEDDYEPKAKKSKGDKKKKKKDKKDKDKKEKTDTKESKSKKKKKEEEAEVWKWWEEEPLPEGIKWRFLEHRGPVFAAPYERLPKKVKFYYDGKHMELSDDAEEVAGFYARMLEHDYTTKEVFNKNFFKDWRKVMTREEQETIKDLRKCNFKEMHAYFVAESEARKNRTKEEKQELKKKNEEIVQEYGFCTIDGHKEKIGNFRIEPPGLFRGRGDHPKQGMLKKRIVPEQVIINCSKDAKVPDPPDGHKWGKVIHDNKVTWLASWTENIAGANKYVMLNPSSRLKGEKDWAKYETARKLKSSVHKIREDYMQDWKSKEMRIRQRAVALYFIDKLALRAGNEKDEGESADTVGCCSLRVEHITLYEEKDGKEYVVEFDFLGKDSIRYQNSVPVEKRVFKNLQLFVENKSGEDDLFDRLNTAILNKYLQDLMDGLTAKVFRTYNASFTLQEQLKALTEPDDSIPSKLLAYNRANRAVAVLCNHQRAAPKTFDKQMENLQEKIKSKMKNIKDAKADYKAVKQQAKKSNSANSKALVERKKKAVERLEDQLAKLEMKATDKEENKEIALGTSKLNYLDPRISVAWCKKWEVPMEKIYNRTQRDKFRWAIDMADEDYEF